MNLKNCFQKAALIGMLGVSASIAFPVLSQSSLPLESESNPPAESESSPPPENQSSPPPESLFQPSVVLDTPKRSGATIADTLKKEEEFKTLFGALQRAGLLETLQQEGAGRFTILAPTNQAFLRTPAYARLLQPQNKEQLVKVLKYHVIEGLVERDDIQRGEIATLEGNAVTISVANGEVMLNDAKGIQPSIEATNGTIVRIDKVLLPPDLE